MIDLFDFLLVESDYCDNKSEDCYEDPREYYLKHSLELCGPPSQYFLSHSLLKEDGSCIFTSSDLKAKFFKASDYSFLKKLYPNKDFQKSFSQSLKRIGYKHPSDLEQLLIDADKKILHS